MIFAIRRRWILASAFLAIGACATAPPTADSRPRPSPVLKELPPEVRKELNARLSTYSDDVDRLEGAEAEADQITDPVEKATQLKKLAKAYSEIQSQVQAVFDDPKYASYRDDPAYDPAFVGFDMRIRYYEGKVKALEMKAARSAESKSTSGDQR